MKSYKLSLILNLALILLNQFFILETKAFFNCENQSCKKNSYSRFSKEKKLIREYKQNFAVINDMTNSIWNDQEEDINTDNNNPNPGGGGSGGGGSSTGGGGRIIPPNDLAQMKACSINIQTVSIRLSYIQCQIESAIDKFKKILELVDRLERNFENLINIMSLATVCDGRGYTRAIYEREHKISSNILILENTLAKMTNLLNDLKLIALDCNNCHDINALNNALSKLDLIQRRVNSTNLEFYSELSAIRNKINDFKRQINNIARRYGVTIDEIMSECRVSRPIARVMSGFRRLAVTTFRRFSSISSQIFSEIETIKKQEHGCSQGEINDDLIFSCAPALA
jgi:hypothetical protein